MRAEAIPELDGAGLRRFGVLTGALLVALFGAALPWLLERAYPAWPWAVGGALVVWALVAPRSLRPVYRLWMRLGLLLNRVTTPLVLAVVFYGVFTPTALIMRVLRRDAMARRFDRGAASYRVESRKLPKEHMERPF